MKFSTLIILSFICLFIKAQPQPILSFKIDPPSDICIDHLDKIYIFNKETIDQYNAKGKKIATYSNNQLGAINKIDVSNPLKVLVLHKDQNTLEILDNTLSTERNTTLDLTNANLYNTSVFAYSSIDNGVWFYDQELFQIIKVDLTMNRIYESGNLLQILGLDTLDVVDLIEHKNKLYLITPTSILIFDNFGAYYSTVHLQDNQQVLSIEENTIFYQTPNYIKAYNLLTFETQETPFQAPKNSKTTLKNNKIYSITDGIFSVFELDSE
ncbi:MAG: hypothetical protein N4A35_16435 [Flavobacteriales bacterium]|jgi:hypothetical protein|nr:hypothetical protein [Flavobacteriales bacterium]